MKTTLTLSLDAELLVQAEKLARESGRSLEETLNRLLQEALQHAPTRKAHTPISREQVGALKGIIHLSPEDEARGYRDIVTEEQAKKYGSL